MCKAQHWDCTGYDSDSHYSHPCESVCTILVLFISLCASRARPCCTYSLSITRKLLSLSCLSLAESLACLNINNGVTARERWQQGHRDGEDMVREGQSVCLTTSVLGTKLLHLCRQIFIQPYANTLTLVDKKGEGNRWALQGYSVSILCRW